MYGRIIDETTRQISNYGFRKFTIDELALNLGISKKTVYKHFKSKNELISTVVENILEQERKQCSEIMIQENSWIEKFQELFFLRVKYRISFRLLNELKNFFPEEWEKVEEFKKYKFGLGKKLLAEGILEEDIRANITSEIIIKSVDRVVDFFINEGFLEQDNLTFNQVLEEIKEIIFYGILKRD